MSANDFHCANQWPSLDFQDPETNALISHAMSYEQMAQQSCDPNQSLLLLQNEQDSWMLSGQYWNGDNLQAAEMAKNPSQWQLWNETTLINTTNEEANLNMGFWNENNNTLPAQNIPHREQERQQVFSQIAAERALFMTPLTHTPISAFPGSPVSDHSSSTELSQATYPHWEIDRERDEIHSSPVSEVMSEIPPSMAAGWTGYSTCPPEDEDDVLVMPDGSTRRNSNWLPVDPHAGFTIGLGMQSKHQPEASSPYFHAESFHDIQGAFISPNPAQYMYNE